MIRQPAKPSLRANNHRRRVRRWLHSSPRCSVFVTREVERNGEVMKKVSLAGVVLGVVLGSIAGLMSGTWLLWLGLGLAIGVVVGSAQANAQRDQPRDSSV